MSILGTLTEEEVSYMRLNADLENVTDEELTFERADTIAAMKDNRAYAAARHPGRAEGLP